MEQKRSIRYCLKSVATPRTLSLFGGIVFLAAAAVAQATLSDAQVEANVLKALAGVPQLANESITTRTVYGTVTLSGSVRDDAARSMAENLAANATGVQKVVDQLSVGSAGLAVPTDIAPHPAPVQSATASVGPNAAPLVLQSDGTYAPLSSADPTPGSAPAERAQRNNPDADQALDQQMDQTQGASGQAATGPSTTGQPGYPPYGTPQPNPQSGNGYPPPQNQPYPYDRRPMGYPQQGNAYGQGAYGQPPYGGQTGGQTVVIPAGAMVRVRINRTLSSQHSEPGTAFDGTVVNDVVAGGLVAIPRGASVQGVVVDATKSGALKGRGELSIQLTQVTLAGKSYPIQSSIFSEHGGDKTTETIDKTAGFGAVGAAVGALSGGGIGAAVGGGVGAALGLGSSASSGRGQVFIPAEGLVTFQLVQTASVQTVSEQEMQRLAYGVPQGGDPHYFRPRSHVYVGPGFGYPGYYPYGPYGYPPY